MSSPLPESLFERVLLPVASETDARIARETILPYLDDVGGTAIVVHVVMYAEDGVAPSPPSVQKEDAARLFEIVSEGDETGIVEETRTAYGTDIAAALFEVARKVDASAIVYSPQEKNRLVRLLTGDTALSLVTNPDVPVLAIPHRNG